MPTISSQGSFLSPLSGAIGLDSCPSPGLRQGLPSPAHFVGYAPNPVYRLPSTPRLGYNRRMDRESEETALSLTHMVRPAMERARSGGAGPGLVLLHGRGANEEDLMGLEGALDPRFTIVSPRAPFRLGSGYAWYVMTQIGRPNDDSMKTSLEDLRAFIGDLPEAYGIDPRRL